MALVIGDVDDAPGTGRFFRDVDPFGDPLDLAQNRIERMLKRPVDRVPLGGAQFVQVRMDALPRLQLGLTVAATQVSRHFFAREHCLGDVVEHWPRLYQLPASSYQPRATSRQLPAS